MPTLAHPKKFLIFALRQFSISSVNHRIYRILHKRLGVVIPFSNYTAIRGCRKLGKATLSLFLNKIKFFTNATTSRKFSTREQQYLTTNAQPSDRVNASKLHQSTTQKESGKTSLLPALGLLIRELYGYVRGLRTQVVQNLFQGFQYCYSVRPNQRKGILCQWQNILRSLRKTDEDHSGRRQYAGSYKPTAYCIKPTAGTHFHNYLVFPALLCAVRGFY